MRSVRPAIAGICALILIACSDAVAPEQELSAARQKWALRGTSSYDITVQISCFCTVETTAPVIVSVRDGIVESRRYAATGSAVPAFFAESFPTVAGLFDIIESAMQDGVARLVVRYDASSGHPLEISIDHVASMADDEIGYLASNLLRR